MYTLQLTDSEVVELQIAVTFYKDLADDTLFDDLSVDIFPTEREATILDYEKAKTLREELNSAVTRLGTATQLLTKVNNLTE